MTPVAPKSCLLNAHNYKDLEEGHCLPCRLCAGYCTPIIITILILCVGLGSLAYMCYLFSIINDSAWRVVLCVIFILIIIFVLLVTLYAYFKVVFTSPGFVPEIPWIYPPKILSNSASDNNNNGNNNGNSDESRSRMVNQYIQREIYLPAQTAFPHQMVNNPNNANNNPNGSIPILETIITENYCENNAHVNNNTNNNDNDNPLSSTIINNITSKLNNNNNNNNNNINPLHSHSPFNSYTGSNFVASDMMDDNNTTINDVDNHAAVLNPMIYQPSSQTEQPQEVLQEAEENQEMQNGTLHSVTNAENDTINDNTVTINPETNVNSDNVCVMDNMHSGCNPYSVSQLNKFNRPRYCYACQLYKPDRAHHCNVCNRCIFYFDHHCPFINNCVGRNNYKLFVVAVLYLTIAAWLAAALDLIALFVIDRRSVETKIGWIAFPVASACFGTCLIMLYIMHRKFICAGETTLDHLLKNQQEDTWLDCVNNKYNNNDNNKNITNGIRSDSAAFNVRGTRQVHNLQSGNIDVSNTNNNTSANQTNALSRKERKKLKREAKKQRVRDHHAALFGVNQPWWKDYLPIPLRTDDRADEYV